VLSLLDGLFSRQIGGIIVVVVCLLACWAGVRFLGYDEFDVARRLAVPHGFRRAVNEQLCLRKFESRMAGAATLEECWPIVRDLCHEVRFHSVSLLSPSQNFGESEPPAQAPVPGVPPVWRLQIAINSEISLVLYRTFDKRDILPSMGFLKIVQLALHAKLLEIAEGPAADKPSLPRAAAAFVGS
jgi:hypothetical protein